MAGRSYTRILVFLCVLSSTLGVVGADNQFLQDWARTVAGGSDSRAGGGDLSGKSVVFDVPGLPSGAKKLELVAVPGHGSVKPFLMGKYEVTQGQYAALLTNNPSIFKSGNDYPVDQTTWNDAKAFCRKLNALLPEEVQGKLTVRLPTDVEWSIAVGLPEESGSTPREKDAKIKDVYPWGTQWPPPSGAGNYASSLKVDNFEHTAPVGSFKPNRYSLCDLGGNVWEWCEDFYDGKSGDRVLRGASHFVSDPGDMLSSRRSGPHDRVNNRGFRVVVAVVSLP